MISRKPSASHFSRNTLLAAIKAKYRGCEYQCERPNRENFFRTLLDQKGEEDRVDQEDKKLVLKIDKMRLFHYKPTVKSECLPPLLITYALINRQYMMDLQPDRSVIKKFVDGGLDVYSIDWGYPSAEDMYISMDDYINNYMDQCVDFICQRSRVRKINLLGVCQGGTFSSIYTSLHQQKIKNLITMVVPIDFESKDALLFRWCKKVDVETLVQAHGVVSGDLLNYMFLYLKPFDLNVDKYRDLVLHSYKNKLPSFLRMERWTFDCPNESGAMLLDCMDGLFKKNLLYKGQFFMNGKKINLFNIKCPVLCVCGKRDHIVPISASKPLFDMIGSKDKEFVAFDTGHIGMYVSTSSQNLVAPKILNWLKLRQ